MLENIPPGWQQRALGEIAAINPRETGLLVPDNTEVSFVPMAAVSETTASITRAETRRFMDVRRGFTPFREGDILFAKITPCMENGKVAIARNLVNHLGFGSTEFHVIRPVPEISVRLIWYFLRKQSTRDYAAQHMTGSAGQRRVSASFMSNLKVPLPPTREEQERLADLLDVVDAACKLCTEIDREMGKLISTLFVAIFGDPETNPKGWKLAPLDQHAEIAGGLQITPGRNSKDGVPYLRVANVYRDRLDLSEIKTMVVSHSELITKALQPGDILVVEGHGNPGELGRAAVWTGAIDPCVHQNHLIRIRLGENLLWNTPLLPEYLSRLINSSYGRNYFLKTGKTTSGLNTISTSVVRNFPVLLPPLELQEHFTKITHIYEARRKDQAEIAIELENLFSSLLSRIFTGKLIESSADVSWGKSVDTNASGSRIVWSKLSTLQRNLWEVSQSFTESFKVEDLGEKARSMFGSSPNREYLWNLLDLLDTLGVTIKEGNNNLDRWRLLDPENDPEIKI